MTPDLLAKCQLIDGYITKLQKVTDHIKSVQASSLIPSDPNNVGDSKHSLTMMTTPSMLLVPVPDVFIKEMLNSLITYYQKYLNEYQSQFSKL